MVKIVVKSIDFLHIFDYSYVVTGYLVCALSFSWFQSI